MVVHRWVFGEKLGYGLTGLWWGVLIGEVAHFIILLGLVAMTDWHHEVLHHITPRLKLQHHHSHTLTLSSSSASSSVPLPLIHTAG